VKWAEIAELHMTSRQESLTEARYICVDSPVFTTTRLNLNICVSVLRRLWSSSILPQRWWRELKSPSSRRGAGSWKS
jgi:hypothetical protein